MIVRAGHTVFLDWELALYGDPLADVAIHLHKMAYTGDEQQRFLTQWTAAEPEAATGNWDQDLRTYLVHEQLKSAVLDAVRFAKVLAERSRTPAEEHTPAAGPRGLGIDLEQHARIGRADPLEHHRQRLGGIALAQ